MNKESILQNWEKSSQILDIPANLRELIDFSFNKNSIPSEALKNYLNDRLHYIIPIIESPPFSIKKNVTSPTDLLKKVDSGLLRDLILILWMQEEEIPEIDGKIDFKSWRDQAFISAFFTLNFEKLFSPSNRTDLFALSFLKNISIIALARTFPSIYEGLRKLKGINQFDPGEQEKVIGASLGELSAWIIEKWGFPNEFFLPLIFKNNGVFNITEKKEIGDKTKILLYAPFFAGYVLNGEKLIKYSEIENLFKKLFRKSAGQFQELFVEILRSLPKQAALFGYTSLTELSIISILKEHINLLNKDLLTYDDLLQEVIKASKRIVQQDKELILLKTQIEQQYIKDPVTGLSNYTYFIEFLNQKIKEAHRYEYPITLILFDLDDFKSFNLECGYQAGNDVLKKVAELVSENIRQSDFVARFRKDEFAVILPYTGLPQSKNVAEKINQLITEYQFCDVKTNKIYKFTVSLGFISLIPQEKIGDGEKLISLALKALKKSKMNVGNTITQSGNYV